MIESLFFIGWWVVLGLCLKVDRCCSANGLTANRGFSETVHILLFRRSRSQMRTCGPPGQMHRIAACAGKVVVVVNKWKIAEARAEAAGVVAWLSAAESAH